MHDSRPSPRQHSRRSVLKIGTGLIASGGLFALGVPSARAASDTRTLSFYHLHTGESLKTTYWADGRPIPGALTEIDYILRDFRTGAIKPIDPDLLNLLHRVRRSLGTTEPFHVISGYRSPTTNATLASHSTGVARHSLHLEGMAIDVRVPGRPLRTLHKAAVAQKAGGVGMYPKSNFVHMDTGRVRYW